MWRPLFYLCELVTGPAGRAGAVSKAENSRFAPPILGRTLENKTYDIHWPATTLTPFVQEHHHAG